LWPTQNQTIGGGFFKGTIPDVKVDPVVAQETKQRIEIAQMNRTIMQMKNEIIRLRRGDNYVANLRMSIQEKRRNPPQENRVRFENMDNPQRQRVPGNQPQMQLFWMMYMMRKWLSKGTIIYLMKVLKLYKWTDVRHPCIYLKKARNLKWEKTTTGRRFSNCNRLHPLVSQATT
jgi:hypothetical protein